MSDKIESSNQNPQAQDLPPSATTAMAETEQSPPNATAAASDKYSSVSFSIWPPTDRTREAVKNRLIETLSSPSILSKRYGTVSRDEAVEAAKIIEQEAFEVAGKAASTDDDGIEILQVYSKEISKRMLETVKARSGESAAAPGPAPAIDEPHKAEEEDAGSTAPPQSEKTDSVADDE
ncbi:MFP1 attachment factor 1-like [Salvia miltiorrhiza]|uniref:MFP1 attachment factor 1-like n=1 Tax=Salvia miltiorrhiza TaxID=226208 RepID=UPI0025AD2A26|nr:MFP1 attachment factor 1-like [Salvia miltiorrhiza]